MRSTKMCILLFILGIVSMVIIYTKSYFKVSRLMSTQVEEPKCITGTTSSILSKEHIFSDRRRHLENICRSRNKTSEWNHKIIGTQDGRLMICLVPKAGCTSWTRILRFINGDNKRVNSPLDIGKFEVHFAPKFTRSFKRSNRSERTIIENSVRVLSVRNPYSRIWSAYVDKLYLPSYWERGIRFIKAHRKNASRKSLKYGHDVTFAEFVEYFLLEKDQHWTPASTLCDPCLFHPYYIVKQETFSSDLMYILDKLGYNIFSNKKNLAIFEIIDQIDCTLRIAEKFKDSLGHMNMIFSRLWRAFQYYGYIPDGLEFPKEKFTVWNKTLVSKIIVDEHNKWNVSKDALKMQKHRLMVQAYKLLPLSTLKQFQQIYKNDFELFQYDSEPADIFIR